MSLPLNTALSATFEFTKAGALFDPTPTPTLVEAAYPDGSVLAGLPLALTHVRTGVYTLTVFAANVVTQVGSYTALSYTSDATADEGGYAGYEWAEVGNNVVTVAGTTAIVSNGPVNGTRTLTTGMDYKAADGLALVVTAPAGYPSFSGGSNALISFNGAAGIAGTILNGTQLSFDVTRTVTATLAQGTYRVSVTLSNGDVVEPEIGQLKIQ